MSLVVFTGGARSGKSAAAVDLVRRRQLDVAPHRGHVLVVAFGEGRDDPEMAARIERHRADRPDGFDVLEASDAASWVSQVDDDALVLVDCLGTLLGRAMTEAVGASAAPRPEAELEGKGDRVGDTSLPDDFGERTAAVLDGVVEWLVGREGDTVVVTNEVGDGVVPAYPSGRLFRDLLGQANRRLIAAADAAYLVVAGRLLEITALPRRADWPAD